MKLTHDGITQPVEEWAADYGLDPFILLLRLEAGWSPADAIETPLEYAPGYRLPPHRSEVSLLPPEYDPSDEREASPARPVTSGKRGNPNGRATSVFVEHDGLRLSLREWSARLNISLGTLYWRFSQGHPAASILAPSFGRGQTNRLRRAGGGKQLLAID